MKEKSQGLINGAMMLVVSAVIVKAGGMLFKIPLTSIIGATGRGYFSAAFDAFVPVYAISLAGLPTALSKLVSQNSALGDYSRVAKTRRVSFFLFICIGFLGSIVLALLAYPYSAFVAGSVNVLPSVLAAAPAVLFCSIAAYYKSFFEGRQNMFPTAVAEVIESLFKMAFGIAFAYMIMRKFQLEFNTYSTVAGKTVSAETFQSAVCPYTAAGAVFGVTAGSIASCVFLWLYSLLHPFKKAQKCLAPSKEIAKDIFKVAMPVALGSVIQNALNFADSITIQNRLAFAVAKDAQNVITQMYSKSIAMSGVTAQEMKTYLFGVYNAALDFKSLVPMITMTLGISALPAISRACAVNSRREVDMIINSVVKYTAVIAFPVGFGMACFPNELLSLFYSGANADVVPAAAPLIRIYGIFTFLLAVSSPLIFMLQGIGKASLSVRSIAVGGTVRLILNYILVGNSVYNIKGAAIAMVCSYGVMVVMNMFFLMRDTPVRLSVASCVFKPFAAAAAVVFPMRIVWIFMYSHMNQKILLLTIILFSVLLYLFLLLSWKIFNKKDIIYLFKSEKILKVLEKSGLLV